MIGLGQCEEGCIVARLRYEQEVLDDLLARNTKRSDNGAGEKVDLGAIWYPDRAIRRRPLCPLYKILPADQEVVKSIVVNGRSCHRERFSDLVSPDSVAM